MHIKRNYFLLALVLCFSSFSFAQLPFYLPVDSLAGWWPLTGNANDESGNGNNGAVYGATLTNDRFGTPNSAYLFNGTSDYIQIPSAADLSPVSNFTVLAWVKVFNFNDTLVGQQSIVSKIEDLGWNGGYEMSAAPNSGGYAGVNDFSSQTDVSGLHTWTSASGYADSTYYMVTTTFDGTFLTIYVDTSLVHSSPASGTIQSSNTPLRFGRRGQAVTYNNWFQGVIDEVGIWDRVLTSSEIKRIFSGCKALITLQPNSDTVNEDSNAQFAVSVADSNATYQWQVDIGSGFQNISDTGQYSGANSGTLTVAGITSVNNNQHFRCITGCTGCSDTSGTAVLTLAITGITNINTDDNIYIYPNPGSDAVVIKANAYLAGTAFHITDATGRTVSSGKLNAGITAIKTQFLDAGVYFVYASNECRQWIKLKL